jgi:O-antigen/teichoic acid export membrane protein
MSSRRIVARNVLILLAQQVLTGALSFAAVPLVARALGTQEYGVYWLGYTVVALAALFMDFGQEVFIVLRVAQSPERASELLGTTVALRLGLSVVVGVLLEFALLVLRFDAQTQGVVFIFYAGAVLASISNGSVAVVRGLEKMAWPAFAKVATEALHTLLLFAAVTLGGRVRGIAAVEIVAAALGLVISARAVARMNVWPRSFDLRDAREMLRGGLPFLLWGGILALQPSIEGVLLSKFASHEAVAWYGASAKLANLLLFPATILGGAFAPTLARLHASDEEGFRRAARELLRASLLLAAPMAVGTWFFAHDAVNLVYGARQFGPAGDNLRVLSGYLAPVFIDISLGTVILVCGRRFAWALSKGAVVAVGAAASFILIPYFQARSNNGGLGAAAICAGGEFLMLAMAFALTPRGILEGRLLVDLAKVTGAAAAMALAARLLGPAPFWIGMIGSTLAYGAALLAIGAVGVQDVRTLRDTLRRAPERP